MKKAMETLQARWAQMAPRERTGLAIAAGVIAFALFWMIGIAPALRTLRVAGQQHVALDAQLQQMQSLAAQAEALRGQAPKSGADAGRALEEAVRQQLGAGARLLLAGDRANITVAGASGAALAQFLAQARLNAQALPVQARLARNASGTWDGTVALTLTAR